MKKNNTVRSIQIRDDILNLNAELPDMMKYGDVCSALNIKDKHLYKLLKSRKIMYVEFERGKRIPSAFFVAFIIEGINCNRSNEFVRKCYQEALYTSPKRMTIEQVCNFLNVSKSTVKRILIRNELTYDNVHDGHLILINKDSLIRYLINHTIK